MVFTGIPQGAAMSTPVKQSTSCGPLLHMPTTCLSLLCEQVQKSVVHSNSSGVGASSRR